MNRKKLKYVNPSAPVAGVPAKRNKQRFLEERENDATEEEIAAEQDYHRRLAEQRKVK